MMSEEEFLGLVVKTARKYGWIHYHAPYIKGIPRIKGFPDLVLVRDRVLFRELKRINEPLKKEQEEWIRRLQDADADAKVWRPNDMDEIETELSVEILEEDKLEDERIELEREKEEVERVKSFLYEIARQKGIDIDPSFLHLE